MSPPSAADLFRAAGLDDAPPPSAAARLADELLAHFGDVPLISGSELQLAQIFGRSPYLVRQALRLLQSRHVVQVQRGVAGGVCGTPPDIEVIADAMGLHLWAMGVAETSVGRAHATLTDPALPLADGSRQFLDLLLGRIAANMQQHGRPARPANRALLIAERLLAATRNRETVLTTTIEEVCDQYGAGRPVAVQALRVLEDMGAVTTRRGRQGGLSLRPPRDATLARRVYPNLKALAPDTAMVHDIIWTINVVLATRVADRRLADPDRLSACGAAIQADHFLAGNPWSQVALLRYLAESAAEPVLHLLVQCLFNYQLCLGAATLWYHDQAASLELAAATREVARSVRIGRPDRAVAWMHQCRG